MLGKGVVFDIIYCPLSLFSLFIGISFFVVYLMLKPSLLKNSRDIIYPIAGGSSGNIQ